MSSVFDVGPGVISASDRIYEAATQITAVLKAYQAEYERRGEEWSAPGIMLRCLLASDPVVDLRHGAEAYAKARGLA